ncbi:hypothetical protein FGG08_005838 [Glutinoglossum americanum]|uniref:Uncharacterized protein n=1 Tax=Glutinoglossum americanum TaxID=1670608 RepID=A0A9P8HXN2_9PEZI|nr:hypothetical protein FGG08_005838 [Glutinoglossum americanum]
MTAVCPSLYTAAKGCWNATTPEKCFCPSIKSIRCPGICATGDAPAAYINWVLKMCDKNDTSNYNATARSSQFRQQWVDFPTLQDDAYGALFPWQWQVKYQQNAAAGANATSYVCPSIQAKLGSFAFVNVLVFVVAAVVGRRDVIEWITNKRCGKLGHHTTFLFTAILSVALNLSANLINAAIIRRNPGFQNVNIGSLVLFWASRPRLAWAAGILVRVQSDKEIYWSLGASAILAEIILQAVGSVYIGITGNWARRYHFYLAHHLDNVPHGNDALLMYGGALLWLVAIGGAVIKAFLTYTSVGQLLMAGLGTVSRFSARVLEYTWKLTYWLLVGFAKFVWKWTKKSTIVLGKSILWGWRWIKIGVVTAHLYFLRKIYDHPQQSLPVVPPRPKWQQVNSMPLDLKPRPGFPPERRQSAQADMTRSFLDDILLVMMFLMIPFIGQWMFWTGYLRMAGSL